MADYQRDLNLSGADWVGSSFPQSKWSPLIAEKQRSGFRIEASGMTEARQIARFVIKQALGRSGADRVGTAFVKEIYQIGNIEGIDYSIAIHITFPERAGGRAFLVKEIDKKGNIKGIDRPAAVGIAAGVGRGIPSINCGQKPPECFPLLITVKAM